MPIRSINPTTGKLLKSFKPFSLKKSNLILGEATSAFHQWRVVSLEERGDILLGAAELLRNNKEDYGKLITLEMGKPIAQSKSEIEKCAWACEYFAKHAREFLRDEFVQTEAPKSYVRFEPLGVILAIMPWNFPFWQVFRFAAPTLMTGNVVILKHASNVPQCAFEIEKIFAKAGAPKGVLATILVEANAAQKLISDSRIAGVTLTGSDRAGRQVGEAAGISLKKNVLELGGSDPFIVLKDADLSRCAAQAAQARTINTGQSCIAAKRFIVESAIAEEFSKLLVENMQRLRVGNPFEETTQIGPLARMDLLESLHKQVKTSLKKGATLLTGGAPIKGPGFFYPPTVLSRVRKGMPAYDEEVFGPVASIIVAKDEAETIKIANDSRFGLGASIWSADLIRAESLAKELEAGCVFINDFVKSDPRLPFGGVKDSGYGRELGRYGIKEFTNIKTINMA